MQDGGSGRPDRAGGLDRALSPFDHGGARAGAILADHEFFHQRLEREPLQLRQVSARQLVQQQGTGEQVDIRLVCRELHSVARVLALRARKATSCAARTTRCIELRAGIHQNLSRWGHDRDRGVARVGAQEPTVLILGAATGR